MTKGKKMSALEVATKEATSKGLNPIELGALAVEAVRPMVIERMKALGVSAGAIATLTGSAVPVTNKRKLGFRTWEGDKGSYKGKTMVTIGFVTERDGIPYVSGWSLSAETLSTHIDEIKAEFDKAAAEAAATK